MTREVAYSEMSESNTALPRLYEAAAEHGECPSCLCAGIHTPATTEATVEYYGWQVRVCDDCAAHNDNLRVNEAARDDE